MIHFEEVEIEWFWCSWHRGHFRHEVRTQTMTIYYKLYWNILKKRPKMIHDLIKRRGMSGYLWSIWFKSQPSLGGILQQAYLYRSEIAKVQCQPDLKRSLREVEDFLAVNVQCYPRPLIEIRGYLSSNSPILTHKKRKL